MSLDWIAHQLVSRQGSLNLDVPRYNPRPAGVIREGSATQSVLLVLTQHKGRFMTYDQILKACKCTDKSVDWGLRFLKMNGFIETTSDDSRNPRYLRYVYKGEKT